MTLSPFWHLLHLTLGLLWSRMVDPSHEVTNTDSPRKAHSMGGASRWHGGQGDGHIFLSFEESSGKRDVNSHLLNVYFVLNTLGGHAFLFLLLGFYFLLPSVPPSPDTP